MSVFAVLVFDGGSVDVGVFRGLAPLVFVPPSSSSRVWAGLD